MENYPGVLLNPYATVVQADYFFSGLV